MATLYVPLTHDKTALIDEEDGPLVLPFRWRAFHAYGRWYAMQSGGDADGRRMHRLILNAPSGVLVDHRNGNGLDNRRENIRFCNTSQNMHNLRGLPRHNTSGFLGVAYAKQANLWRAVIHVDRKIVQLGYYRTKEEAARAYDAAARERFDGFARMNFPRDGELGIRADGGENR